LKDIDDRALDKKKLDAYMKVPFFKFHKTLHPLEKKYRRNKQRAEYFMTNRKISKKLVVSRIL
jgi:hypothetical protein